ASPTATSTSPSWNRGRSGGLLLGTASTSTWTVTRAPRKSRARSPSSRVSPPTCGRWAPIREATCAQIPSQAERSVRIAFQGEIGAYSQEAIQLLEGSPAEPLPCRTFRAAFQGVADGPAAAAVVPIENSIAGPVIETQDLLLEYPLFVTGEAVVRVRHCLLAREADPLAAVKAVHSHPQALAQCSRFIEK